MKTRAEIDKLFDMYENLNYKIKSCSTKELIDKLGYAIKNRVLHVVVGISDTRIWLITAYEPSIEQWNNDFKVRKDR